MNKSQERVENIVFYSRISIKNMVGGQSRSGLKASGIYYQHFATTYPQSLSPNKNVQRFLTHGFSMRYERM
jgi:hypothetical protein